MSRAAKSQTTRRGPQLPFSLQQELGLPSNKKRQRTQIAERKQRRQDVRNQTSSSNKRRKFVHDKHEEDTIDEEEFSDKSDVKEVSEDEADSILDEPIVKRTQAANTQLSELSKAAPETPSETYDDESDDLSRGSREYSPEVILDASSKTFQDRQAEEDAEIAALERRLGSKGRKSQNGLDDGFEDLLGSLDDPRGIRSRKAEARRWLEEKRQNNSTVNGKSVTQSSRSDSGDTDSDLASKGDYVEEETDLEVENVDEFEGFEEEVEDAEEGESPQISTQRQQTANRENPYIAPISDSNSTAKYVPPAQRKLPSTDTALLMSLRRKAQGSINKLSEANIISIVDEFEKLYQDNPRQDVTQVVIDLLMTTLTDPSPLQNTFIILHAAFIAALYKVLGADFGAEMISRLVEVFDKLHNDVGVEGKECLNLTSLLANLFTLGVISSTLIFDHIKLLLSKFSEESAELLLRMIRDCGPQLRADAPTALKDIVQMMNQISVEITSNGQTLSVRTRVMMDTITDLKNNKMRQATNATSATGEHLTRMRKALGSLNTRQLRATDPLGVSRSDILNGSKKGKWWLVGASWKGGDPVQTPAQTKNRSITAHTSVLEDEGDDEINITALTSQLRLPTPTARSIFIAITTATDPTDALMRLSKLRLTKRQEPEIARIIIRVCRAEASYNPYYAAVARLLLREKRAKMSFQIALWKFFRQIGESPDDEEGDDSGDEQSDLDHVQPGEIANVALMYASLISRRALDLNVIKTLSIGFTRENATLFLELLLISIFTNSKLSDEQIVQIFSTLELRLVKSLAYFLRQQVRKTDLVSDKHEKEKVKAGCRTAQAALSAMQRGNTLDVME